MYVELISNQNHTTNIELSERRPQPDCFEINPAMIVYQDIHYSVLVKGITAQQIPQIVINDELLETGHFGKINGTPVFIAEQDGWLFQFKRPIFDLIYGLTNLCVMLPENDRVVHYHAPYLAVALKAGSESLMESLKHMLTEIYSKEHILLKRDSGYNTTKQLHKLNTLDQDSEKIAKILQSLTKALIHFATFPKTIPQNTLAVDSFEKLRFANQKTIAYIATHPNELARSSRNCGIQVQNSWYMPKKTLIDSISISKNNFENMTIVSFINTVHKYINDQIYTVEQNLIHNKMPIVDSADIRPGYVISFSIIEQYLTYSFEEYLINLRTIEISIRKLVRQYKDALINTAETLAALPAPTPTLLEVNHYREIYNHMIAWFSDTKPHVPVRQELFNFLTADRIYEYYCLLSLTDVLITLGFSLASKSLYPYRLKNSDYHKSLINCDVNTILFTTPHGDDFTVYYQPIIYAQNSASRNDISLFRVDESYYSPDFIFKYKNRATGAICYAIFDAKWRNRASLSKNSGGIKDCLYKYYASVADESTGLPVNALWLLQGKDDAESTMYFRRGQLSTKCSPEFRSSIGIVRVTPQTGTSDLLKVLKQILSQTL